MLAIARTAAEHRDEITAWLADFGALNGVAKVPRPVLAQRLHNLRAFARLAWMDRLVFYPDREPPITDIAQAARIGGEALALAPNPLMTALSNTVRRLRRAL